MAGRLTEESFDGALADRLKMPPAAGLTFHWLGQAGFVIDIAGRRLVVDPYLSDSLAEKYRGTPRPHRRMMPPPVAPAGIAHVDYVCCTHAHTDHMDPGTLPALLAANPSACLVAPRAMRKTALDRSGLAESRLIAVEAGESLELSAGLGLTATRAAHETLERDDAGDHRFLGYCLSDGASTLWHSGDCIPFDGLAGEIAALRPDIALLPVNGRRPELSDNGVPGNFTLDEAVDIARAAGASVLVAHHYGLFDFNTLEPGLIDVRAMEEAFPRLVRARQAIAFRWDMPGRSQAG
ncbi:MAG: MBL fold metallo-hydrolase [Rhizobiaceae bacterium]|nr:MBL fold metallo-hydrolase [Rhizobiaceae bacterium]